MTCALVASVRNIPDVAANWLDDVVLHACGGIILCVSDFIDLWRVCRDVSTKWRARVVGI